MTIIPEVEAFLDGSNIGSDYPYRTHPTCFNLESNFRYILDGTNAEFDKQSQSYIHKETGLTAARFYRADVALRYTPEEVKKDEFLHVVHDCLVLVKDPDYFRRRTKSGDNYLSGVGAVNGIALIDGYVYALRLPHDSSFNGLMATRPIGKDIHDHSRDPFDVGYDYQQMLGAVMGFYTENLDMNRIEQLNIQQIKLPKPMVTA